MKSIGSRLFLFFLLELIALCLIASYRFINLESAITLFIFNFLFASLTFQLNGTMPRKLGMLALGNVVGFFWNFLFYCFALAGAMYFGKSFDAFYTVIYPLLNLMWIVPFWSLSLGVLPKMQTVKAEVEPK